MNGGVVMNGDVVLDFELDADQVARLAAVDMADASATVIEHSCLLMPVRFVVGGQVMLRGPRAQSGVWAVDPDGVARRTEAQWLTNVAPEHRILPILSFAGALSTAVEELESAATAAATVPDGGLIRLIRIGASGRVAIVGETGATAEAELASLRAAVMAFRAKVAAVMVGQLPVLRTIPGLSSWYRA